MWRLFAKDLRAHGPSVLLAACGFAVLAWMGDADRYSRDFSSLASLCVASYLLAAFVGAELVASESRSGTWELLLRLPLSKRRILAAKLIAGIALVATFALIGLIVCGTQHALAWSEARHTLFGKLSHRSCDLPLAAAFAALAWVVASGMLAARWVTSSIPAGLLGVGVSAVGAVLAGWPLAVAYSVAHEFVLGFESYPGVRVFTAVVVASALLCLFLRMRGTKPLRAVLGAGFAGAVTLAVAFAPTCWSFYHLDASRVGNISRLGVLPEANCAFVLASIGPAWWDLAGPSHRWWETGSRETLVAMELDSGAAHYAQGRMVDAWPEGNRLVGVWPNLPAALAWPPMYSLDGFDLWSGTPESRFRSRDGVDVFLSGGHLFHSWMANSSERRFLVRGRGRPTIELDCQLAPDDPCYDGAWTCFAGFLRRAGLDAPAATKGVAPAEALVLRLAARRIGHPVPPQPLGDCYLVASSEDGESLLWRIAERCPDCPAGDVLGSLCLTREGRESQSLSWLPLTRRTVWLVGSAPLVAVALESEGRDLLRVFHADGREAGSTVLAHPLPVIPTVIPYRDSNWRVYASHTEERLFQVLALDARTGQCQPLGISWSYPHVSPVCWQVVGDTLYWSDGPALQATHMPDGATRRIFPR